MNRLLLACGNDFRGDDALGLEFAGLVERRCRVGAAAWEVISATQFQVEHAFELQGRDEVIFVDAAAGGPAPFSWTPLSAAVDPSFGTHAISAAAVLGACARAYGPAAVPPASLLAIRGEQFEPGTGLSRAARRHLAAAWRCFRRQLRSGLPRFPPQPARSGFHKG